jgi:hypothetical protein
MNETLEKPDMNLILRVYNATQHMPGTPFLIAGRSFKRTKKLVDSGLLKDHNVNFMPRAPDWIAVSVTQSGIEAYNKTIAAMLD